MKTPVIIALLVLGSLLIGLPPISDQVHTAQVASLLARTETQSVRLEGRMSEEYRLGCWLVGTFMIGFAIWSCRAGARTEPAAAMDRSVTTAPSVG